MPKTDRIVPAGDGGGGRLIAVSGLGQNDVLLGRGSGVQYHPGNVAFRRHVQGRKAEYVRTKSTKLKAEIAQEIVDHIRQDLSPPGRFLRQAGDGCWEEIDDKTAFEKVKQALRQQPKSENKAGGAVGNEKAEEVVVQAVQARSGGSPKAGNGSAKSANDDEELDVGINRSADAIGGDLRRIRQQRRQHQKKKKRGGTTSRAARNENMEADWVQSTGGPEARKGSANSHSAHMQEEGKTDFCINKSADEIESDLRLMSFGPDEVVLDAQCASAAQASNAYAVDESNRNNQIGYFDRLRLIQNANRSNNAAGSRLLLSCPNDHKWLSPQLCLIRSQIEVFEATAEDVEARFKKGGTNQRISIGQVGIRCIHCAHVPRIDRTKGAILYPNSIRLVHQAVRNWQRYHLGKCGHIPSEVREQLEKYKSSRCHSGAASLRYWVESCKSLGMVDAAQDDGGVFLSRRLDCKIDAGVMVTPATVIDRKDFVGGHSDDVKLGEEEQALAPVVSRLANGVQVFPDDIRVPVKSTSCAPPSDPSYAIEMHPDSASRSRKTPTLAGSLPPEPISAPVNSGESYPLEEPQDEKQHLRGRVQLAYDIVRSTHEIRLFPSVPSPNGANDGHGESVRTKEDLFSLGVGLYEWFAGRHPFEGNGDSGASCSSLFSCGNLAGTTDTPRKKRDTVSVNRACTPLKELGFPMSLCSLVSSLLGVSDACNSFGNHQYETTDEVEEDLRLMISDPDRFLFDASFETMMSGKLDFPRNIYGREKEVATLLDAYDRAIESNGACEVVMVSGYSGTGKSSLVQLVQGLLEEKGAGFFLSGKFDKLRQAKPLSAIVVAFSEYCDILLARDKMCVDKTRAAIENAVGSDGKVLVDLIPKLEKIIGKQTNPLVAVEVKQAHLRLMFLFKVFVRAIASSSHPLILFLDDLQWADEASLELIASLVTDPGMSSLLLLGCYRDNEVGDDHPLALQLSYIQDSGISMSSIMIGNIDRDSVNALVSDTLHLLPRVTLPLADIVFRKTGGNGLFVVQFLEALCDEGSLRFSLTSRRWEWDLDAIQSKAIAGNVVDLMKAKMLRLSPDVQRALRIAACLGYQCEESIVRLFDVNLGAMLASLDAAVSMSLMFRVGSSYKFSHDQIHYAAYCLTPEDARDSLHLEIGRRLIKGAPRQELDNILFVVIDQVNRGLSLVTDEDEKFEIARLNLRAGEKAMRTSSFLTASKYFKAGISLLDEEAWGGHYQLCLDLYTSCSEAEYVLGCFAELKVHLAQVFKHARGYGDKLRSYTTLVTSLGTQGKIAEAAEKALEVLSLLGERFPSAADNDELMRDLALTQEMLDKMTEDEIVALNELQDKDKIAAMNILKLLILYTLMGKWQWLLPYVVSRMVRLSLSRGVCKASPVGFASYGMILCGQLNDTKRGYRFGKIALSLLERLNAKDCAARVYAVVYGCINNWAEPLQVSMQSHRHAYEVGMSTGDVEYAMLNAQMETSAALQSGIKLELLIERTKNYVHEMRKLKQMLPESMAVPFLQAALNLTGRNDDPVKLTGEFMDEDEMVKSQNEKGNFGFAGLVYLVRLWLAYWFRRYELAAEMLENRRKLDKGVTPKFEGKCSLSFYDGLVSFAMARSKEADRSMWESRGRGAIQNMTIWAEGTTWNCQNKLDLLLAEHYFLTGDTARAANAYDDSIVNANSHKFVNEEALACERAGIFHSSVGNFDRATHCYARAYKCYLEWGATAKADHLVELGNAVARADHMLE